MIDVPQSLPRFSHRGRTALTPIVPQGDVRGVALVVVIAIMSFLACLALGGVNVTLSAAKDWEGQISREATIQFRSMPEQDMEEVLLEALELVQSAAGTAEARILDLDETARLLEPWLGKDVDMEDLPIPRLIIVTFRDDTLPDTESLRTLLEQNIPGSSFDDHRPWIDRLASMAQVVVLVGIGIFCLTLMAMILSVVFATRATLLGNVHIIEVLHFIGADAAFVARQFDWHFLRAGFKGAAFGGLAALLLFWLVQLWSQHNLATPEGSQFATLFGSFSLSLANIIEAAVLVVFVAFLTMFTSRSTVIRQLHEIDRHEVDFFGKGN